jgi:hypothetical protein
MATSFVTCFEIGSSLSKAARRDGGNTFAAGCGSAFWSFVLAELADFAGKNLGMMKVIHNHNTMPTTPRPSIGADVTSCHELMMSWSILKNVASLVMNKFAVLA